MTARTILRNSVSLVASEFANKVLNIAFFALLARYLDSSDTGVYITLITFLSVGLFITDPGLSQTLVRNISRANGETSSDLAYGIIMTIFLWLSAWAGMLVAAPALGYPDTLSRLLIPGGIYLGFQASGQVAAAYIKARQRMGIVAVGNSLPLTISSGLGIVLLIRGAGLATLVSLVVLQGILQCLFFWQAAIRLGFRMPRMNLSLGAAFPFVKEVLPVALLGGTGIALNTVDIFMLSKIKGMTDTAHYGLAVRLIDNLSLLSGSILTAMLPFFSAKWDKPGSDFPKWFVYASKFFLVLGMVFVAVVTIHSMDIVTLLFGARYAESSRVLAVLIWSFSAYLAGAPLSIMILIDKTRIAGFLPFAIATIAVNVMLNLWLIPRYSYMGASVSTLVCSVLLLIAKVRFVRDSFPLWKDVLHLSRKPFLATVGMAAVMLLSRSLPLVTSLLLGAGTFMLILFSLGEFDGAEYSILDPKQVFQRGE